VPTSDGGDDLLWVFGSVEGARIGVGIGHEAVDGGLKRCEGMEHAPFEAPFCELGEKALDGVEPRG